MGSQFLGNLAYSRITSIMMKCKKCGSTLLMEQIPEVHISEAEVDCGQPGCDGKAVYINNKSNIGTGTGTDPSSRKILREENNG